MSTATLAASAGLAHRCIHLSASAIQQFLKCPNCFYLKYVCGIRPEEDPDALRMGTNWHALHEVYRNELVNHGDTDPGQAFNLAIEHLNRAYQIVPDNKEEEEWELEREILSTSFAVHCWVYQDDPLETLATEVPFELPVFEPRLGLPLPISEVKRLGKIDRFVRYNGRVSISDYKSTSSSIDADSDFWAHLKLDPQISMYVSAGQELAAAGALEHLGITAEEGVTGAYYDVWAKPKIRPKDLTQAESAEFESTGTYFGNKFEVEVKRAEDGKILEVWVGRRNWLNQPKTQLQFKEGATKKDGTPSGKFAVRENIEMYGARLMAEMQANPDKYFARKEIPRTDAQIRRFRREIYGIYQTMKAMRNGNWWHRNGTHDMMNRHGDMALLCYDDSFDPHTHDLPAGFKRLWDDRKENAA